MSRRFARELKHLRHDEPGARFEAGHERTRVRNNAVRLLLVGLGCTLMLAAALTFWLPGPNFVLVLAGLALVGGQSRTVARLMDRVEVRARRWHQERWVPFGHKRPVLAIAWLLFGSAVLAVAYVSWRTLF